MMSLRQLELGEDLLDRIEVVGAVGRQEEQMRSCCADGVARSLALMTDGARFEVHLTKARGIFGEDAEPFEAKLVMDPEWKAVWTCTDLGEEDDEEMEQVLALAKAGSSVREIASQIDKPKTLVHRILQKAKQARAAEAGARPN